VTSCRLSREVVVRLLDGLDVKGLGRLGWIAYQHRRWPPFCLCQEGPVAFSLCIIYEQGILYAVVVYLDGLLS
jgi:hypothetical protein